jgi:hypothetical protein
MWLSGHIETRHCTSSSTVERTVQVEPCAGQREMSEHLVLGEQAIGNATRTMVWHAAQQRRDPLVEIDGDRAPRGKSSARRGTSARIRLIRPRLIVAIGGSIGLRWG